MNADLPVEAPATDWVSTGQLPREEVVRELVAEAHHRFAPVQEGELARYIPALAEANPAHFGICVAASVGPLFEAGESRHPIQYSEPLEALSVRAALRGHR